MKLHNSHGSPAVAVGDLVRVYVSENRSWRVCQVDTVDDGELECSDVESGADIVVAEEEVQHPVDFWLCMPWANKLREASKLKEHGNTLYRHRDASRALHWYHKAASYLELEFSDEMQRAKEASAPHRVAAFTQLRVGQTVFVVPTKYARIVLRAERMARKASARAETARKGWARPPIATETLALQHARPASIAYLDEEEKTVDVIFADTAAGEEAGAATETGAGAAASSAAGAAAGAAGAAEEEEDEELLPSEEDGVPAWRVWTVGTLPVRGALDNDGQHEEEVGSENGVVAGAGSSAEPVRWASPKRRPEAVCSEAEAESALDLYRACLMNAARCNAFNKQWADVDALASQVVALRPTDAAAFLLRAKARLALAWLPQAAHDLKLCERLAAEEDPGTLRKVAKVRESLKSRRRHAKAHGRRAIKQILQYVDTVQMGAGEGKGEDGPSGAAM